MIFLSNGYSFLRFFLFSLGDVLLHSTSVLSMDPLEGTLTIEETLDVDAGVYTCVAVNSVGTSSGKISLDVGGKSVATFHQF